MESSRALKFSEAEFNRLLALARKGDQEASSRLCESYRAELYAYIVKRGTNRTDSEDIIQQVFVAVWLHWKDLRGNTEAEFSHWLFRIAKTRSINYHERVVVPQQRTVSIDMEDAREEYVSTDASENPEALALQKDIGQRLHQAIGMACNSKERNILYLRDLGFSYSEIMDVLEKRSENPNLISSLLYKRADKNARLTFLRSRMKVVEHLYLHDPDLLGGQDGIAVACERNKTAPEIDDRLTSEDLAALNARKPGNRLRNALQKLSPYLDMPLMLLLIGLWTWNNPTT